MEINTIHINKQMASRGISNQMVQKVMLTDKQPEVQLTHDDQIELLYTVNWNGDGNLMVVTNHNSTILITAKWARFSTNWWLYDNSEDKQKYGNKPRRKVRWVA